MKKKQQQGFTALEAIVILLVVAIVAFAGWYVWQSQKKKDKDAATNTSQQTKNDSQDSKDQTPATDTYAGWKAYENTKYGFSFKYPAEWTVTEVPIDTPSGTDPQEFAANVKISSNEKYSETAAAEVHTDNLAKVTSFYDSYYAESSSNVVDKKTETLKGKSGVQYTVTNSGQKSKLYLFSVGEKTYSFRSVNESLNEDRSASYWTDFDKAFDSLTIK